MSYEEFLNATLGSEEKSVPEKYSRTAADIEAELMPLVEIDRRKGG